MWLGNPKKVRQWSRKVAKVMNGLGVEVGELHKPANFLLRRTFLAIL
jgi:hypothetical protein